MPRILLVDDDREFRDSVEKSLKSVGYEVTTAENGRKANDIFQINPKAFVAIVSDMKMPELDGVGFLKAVRATSSIPFILMTGFTEILETYDADSLGASDFLAKPFKQNELVPALARALGKPAAVGRSDSSAKYCKLGIDDFATGRKIKFSIYIRLADDRYIKVAHKGEDISIERIRAYKHKGLSFLYLRQEDFRQFVGFDIDFSSMTKVADQASIDKKLNLLKVGSEVLYNKIRYEGLESHSFISAAAFVEASMDVLTDDLNAMTLLESLRAHSDRAFAHSLGVSVYSVLISQHVKWNLPTNKFKLALAGLLHDVGEKEIGQHILATPRTKWSEDDRKAYESHVMLGYDMLEEVKSLPEDVRQIVKQHHENCASQGFPFQTKKTSIHPMAKLLSVADEFCYRTLGSQDSMGTSPLEALQEMTANCYETLDKEFLGALVDMFKAHDGMTAV